jgi:DNA-binding NtrC family response regulator
MLPPVQGILRAVGSHFWSPSLGVYLAMSKLPILVVDDDPDVCFLMAKLLSVWGYEVDTAHNGRAALQFVEQRRYGIAVIDYQMPGMNGVDLFRRMRRARPELSAVFLTGFPTIDVVYPAIEAGVLRVLPKPADFQELLPILEAHLNPAT